jgi:hypothetical protein
MDVPPHELQLHGVGVQSRLGKSKSKTPGAPLQFVEHRTAAGGSEPTVMFGAQRRRQALEMAA